MPFKCTHIGLCISGKTVEIRQHTRRWVTCIDDRGDDRVDVEVVFSYVFEIWFLVFKTAREVGVQRVYPQ